MLPTIYEWSVHHIKNVFEAKSEDECIRAIDATFSHNIEFTTNGKQLDRADLQHFVLTMVNASGFRLKVQWQNALEVPRDETNRVSCTSFYPTLGARVGSFLCGRSAGRRPWWLLHYQQHSKTLSDGRTSSNAL